MAPPVKKVVTSNVNLLVTPTPLIEAFHTIEVTRPTWLKISAHVVLKHRKNYYREDGGGLCGVGFGLVMGLRGPGATAGDVNVSLSSPFSSRPEWIYGAKSSGNIDPPEIHYWAVPLSGFVEVTTPGFYRIEPWANCHGSTQGTVLADTDSVVEVSGALENTFIYELGAL